MIINIKDDFNLDKIADSGQCFRWEKTGPETYRIIAGESCLYISNLGEGYFDFKTSGDGHDNFKISIDDRYNFKTSDDEPIDFWLNYFDLQENYQCIRHRIDAKKDPFLWQAAEHEKGIRILRQDPWEMLISFIISQNKNIPAICRSVQLLAESCGEKKTDCRGQEYYGFPSPHAISSLSKEDLITCKLGYRWKYVHAAADAVLRGEIDLEHLQDANEKTTIASLTRLFGVGVKVANCVSLFGLHHVDAFPIDVWVKRILTEQYPDGYPFEKYSPYNGIYQQYMFAHYRHMK